MIQNVLLLLIQFGALVFISLHLIIYRKYSGTVRAIADLFSTRLFQRIHDYSNSSRCSLRDKACLRLESAALYTAILLIAVYGAFSFGQVEYGWSGGDLRPYRAKHRIAVLRIRHVDRDVMENDRLTLQNLERVLRRFASSRHGIEKVAARTGVEADEVAKILRRGMNDMRLGYLQDRGPGYFALEASRTEDHDREEMLIQIVKAFSDLTNRGRVTVRTGRRQESMERVLIDVVELRAYPKTSLLFFFSAGVSLTQCSFHLQARG